MAKVSGRDVAEAILKKLDKEIQSKKLKPKLAIILAGNDPSSRIYVQNKIKTAARIGVTARLYEFAEGELDKCIKKLNQLNNDPFVNGIIMQYPTYPSWNYDELLEKLDPKKDVDGFLTDSPFSGATALGGWEMLTAFSLLSGFKKTKDFLQGKKNSLVR